MATRQGTFVGMEEGRFGPKITVTTQKGNWSLDWRGGQLPPISQGMPVSFEAAKNARGFWECTGIMPAGQGGFQQVAQAAPMPQQPVQPAYQQMPAPAPQAMAQPEMRGASKDCGMFVMAVLGKGFQGQGTCAELQDLHTMRQIIYNLRLAWEIEMEDKPEPQPQQAQAPQPVPAQPAQFVPNASQQPYDELNPPPHGQNILAAGE